MSDVVLNRGTVDVTDVEIEQAGSPSCEIITEQPLLDSTKDYVMGCTSCVVPLASEPMMTFDISTSQLFTVRRRKYNAPIASAQDELNLPVNNEEKAICALVAGYKIFSVTDLVTYIANWTATFSNAVADLGLTLDGAGNTVGVNVVIAALDPAIDRRANGNTGTRLLGVALTSGGTLQLVGSAIFWNNFYIVPNAYCREILGFPDIVCLSDAAESESVDHLFNVVNNVATILDQTDPLHPTNFPAASPQKSYSADYSIFRKTEERMIISMEVALSIPMNVSIVNGIETRTHTVFTAPLQSEIISTVKSENGIIRDMTNLSIKIFQGRVHLLKKTSGNVQWYPLSSSYQIQNSRCELFMTRRRFSDASGKWYTERNQFKVDADGVWNASLKFVSVF